MNRPTFALKLQCEVEKPLLTFRGDNFKKDMKKYDHHIADLRKQLVSRYAAVEKVWSIIMISVELSLQTIFKVLLLIVISFHL